MGISLITSVKIGWIWVFILPIASLHPLGTRDDIYEEVAQNVSFWPHYLVIGILLATVGLLIGCLNCCKDRAGFKEFRNESSTQATTDVDLDFVNRSHLNNVENSGQSGQLDSIITFEPLPQILLRDKVNGYRIPLDKPLHIITTNEWFDQRDTDFPRHLLHYVHECGRGWFGKVIEGEAQGITRIGTNKVSRVFVRILQEDATNTEQILFLYEAKAYKQLTHPNILRLVGKCLDNVPLLLLFEGCANGDLKSYLHQNSGNRDALILQGTILRMAIDVATGLNYMLQNGFIHTDVAARNCLVTSDIRVKIGDYGTSVYSYKDEYMISGNTALPVRWYPPEVLSYLGQDDIKQASASWCVWSYGVLLWELEEWVELPYVELTDEQVIQRVCQGIRLQCAPNRTPYTEYIYGIMEECWKVDQERPSLIHLINELTAILHKFKNNNFENRWERLKHNNNGSSSPIEIEEDSNTNIKRVDSDSGIDLDNNRYRYVVPQTELKTDNDTNLTNSELYTKQQRSPSMENLHGSLENLDSFWFTGDLDFKLGPLSEDWKPLFSLDSYQDSRLGIGVGGVGGGGGDSSLDTDDEIWRNRIERCEFTEKVKEKSKSVADLMILTHIDGGSEGGNSEPESFTSLTRQSSLKKGNNPKGMVNFGSESSLLIVDNEFQDTLKKLQIAKLTGNEESSMTYYSLQMPNTLMGNSNSSQNNNTLPYFNSTTEGGEDGGNDDQSVVLGPSESDTLGYFQGLKSTLTDLTPEGGDGDDDDGYLQDWTYDKIGSDDSGRGTEQVNSGDRSLEGTTSVKEVKLEDVVAKFESCTEDGCSSIEDEGESEEELSDDLNEYGLSDIIEGLADEKKEGWYLHAQVVDEDEEEEGYRRKVDEDLVEAIRNELREKLPSLSYEVKEEAEEEGEDHMDMTIEYNTYPAQLSPILEEDEDDSSLASSRGSLMSTDTSVIPRLTDDILLVNTITHEAILLDGSCSSSGIKLNETYNIQNDDTDDTDDVTDNFDTESILSLSPGSSSKTGAAISCSSSESGNLSDVFLSPTGSKTFDDIQDESTVFKSMDEEEEEEGEEEAEKGGQIEDAKDKWLEMYLKMDDEQTMSDRVDTPTNFSNENWPTVTELTRNDDWTVERNNVTLDGEKTPTNDESSENLFFLNKFNETPIKENSVSNGYENVEKLHTVAIFGENIENPSTAAILDENVEKPSTATILDENVEKPSTIAILGENFEAPEKGPEKPKSLARKLSENDDTDSSSSSSSGIDDIKEYKIILNENYDSSPEDHGNFNDSLFEGKSQIPEIQLNFQNNENEPLREIDVDFPKETEVKNSNISGENPKFMEIQRKSDNPEETRMDFLNTSDNTIESTYEVFSSKPSEESIKENAFSTLAIDYTSESQSTNLDSSDQSIKSFLKASNLDNLGIEEVNPTDVLMSTSFIEPIDEIHKQQSDEEEEEEGEGEGEDDGTANASSEFNWKKDDKKEEEKKIEENLMESSDDDEDDDCSNFRPSTWNSTAVPRKSAILHDAKKGKKKNVSFKKQRYHCVYEYPKEDINTYIEATADYWSTQILNYWGIENDPAYYSEYFWDEDRWDHERNMPIVDPVRRGTLSRKPVTSKNHLDNNFLNGNVGGATGAVPANYKIQEPKTSVSEDIIGTDYVNTPNTMITNGYHPPTDEINGKSDDDSYTIKDLKGIENGEERMVNGTLDGEESEMVKDGLLSNLCEKSKDTLTKSYLEDNYATIQFNGPCDISTSPVACHSN